MKLLVEAHDCRVGSHPLKIATPIPRVFGVFAVLDDKVWGWDVMPLGLKYVLIIVREEETVDLLTLFQWNSEQAWQLVWYSIR